MAKTMFDNAVASIECGIEDYQEGEDKRVISAIRNLYAGVLLLLKDRLFSEHPALIAAKLKPSIVGGKVEWEQKGHKTVDFDEIKEHWKALGWTFDWGRLSTLRGIRNAIEHHKIEHPVKALQEAVAAAFILVVKALEPLGVEPAEVLDEAVWQTMLDEAKLVRELSDECLASRSSCASVPEIAVDAFSEHAHCPSCESALLKVSNQDGWPDTGVTCKACGEASTALEVLPNALALHYGSEDVETCPHCNSDTFVTSEGSCGACGEGLDYGECLRCGDTLGAADQDNGGLCDYCSYVSEKMDRE